MKVHPYFYAGRGEIHFFNRASNFKKGYDWYRKGLKMINFILSWRTKVFFFEFFKPCRDQMPLVFNDEVCYEKTPDYFDRPFVPERIARLENSKSIKLV